jgi:hypothetical protein
MPYTKKALWLVWMLIFGLAWLAGFGVVTGPRVLLLVLATGGVPLILTLFPKPRVIAEAPTSRDPHPRGPRVGNQSAPDSSGLDVLRWESDGGAQRVRTTRGRRRATGEAA